MNFGTLQPWRMEAEEVCRILQVDPRTGLSQEEARRRREQFGPNALPEGQGPSPVRMFLAQFTEAMVILLIVAAAISWALGDIKESIAILVIVILNALLGFSQEYRAERALAALRKMTVPTVRVRRDGHAMDVPATDVVPGDILLLEAGDAVAADARVLRSISLRVEEAALTGESQPISKHVDPIPVEGLPVAERRNMIFMGTWVTYGKGEAVVTATGHHTELGKIAHMLHTVEREPTPLQKRLARLGRDLSIAAVALIVLIFLLGLLRGEDPRLMFITAISMAVAAVPEGLPAVVTIALALGAQRMLRRRALIRKLPAVETLGSVTVICTDKTGTLTQNRMTVTVLDGFGKRLDVAQVVQELPQDDVVEALEKGAKQLDPDFLVMLVTGALCNDAELLPPENGDGYRAVGDPTEGALVVAAAQFGLPKPILEKILPRVAEVPFTSERKRMVTVHQVRPDLLAQDPHLTWLWETFFRNPPPPYVVFAKGAADVLLKLSDRVWKDGTVRPMTDADRQTILEENERLAEQGIRVLGLAVRRLDVLSPEERLQEEVEHRLVFVGLVGMMDPLRPEAQDAVRTCQEAGIQVKMITGDHPTTARTIARQLDLMDGGELLTGYALHDMDRRDLEARVEQVAVFARVSPEHKLHIVEALQNRGHIVAMTGDGVNDAPALKKADIGVAMGITGTEVAKEASEMVLLDDNFATIVAAVEEGRIIYDNIRKFIKYTMTSNTGELLVMLLAPFFGMPLPLRPLQILWINLVTDGLPGLALTVEPGEKDVMKRPPYNPQARIFDAPMVRDMGFIGLLMGLVSLGVGFWYYAFGGTRGQEIWQTMVFTTLTLAQMGNALAIRSSKESLFTRGLRSNLFLLVAVLLTFGLQLAVIYVPALQSIFNTVALGLDELVLALVLSTVVFWGVELEKVLVRRGWLKES